MASFDLPPVVYAMIASRKPLSSPGPTKNGATGRGDAVQHAQPARASPPRALDRHRDVPCHGDGLLAAPGRGGAGPGGILAGPANTPQAGVVFRIGKPVVATVLTSFLFQADVIMK
jgi:hypothetical protein